MLFLLLKSMEIEYKIFDILLKEQLKGIKKYIVKIFFISIYSLNFDKIYQIEN